MLFMSATEEIVYVFVLIPLFFSYINYSDRFRLVALFFFFIYIIVWDLFSPTYKAKRSKGGIMDEWMDIDAKNLASLYSKFTKKKILFPPSPKLP